MISVAFLSLLASVAASANIKGVNVGGWLLIEEWMFSNGMFDKVAEWSNEPQGVILPPALPNGFGEYWYSEGDLIYKLYKKFGEARTIDILTQHRETYITNNDFKEMAARGISQVRLPVGWWAFANESTQTSSKLITDPAHSDKMFVTITQDFLRKVLGEIHDAGLKALIDIHAFPGGSASGSYSGIFPSEPMFFSDAALQEQGFDVLNSMFDFYAGLDSKLQASVIGMTLMNEPAHSMPQDGETMLAWMDKAVDLFRQRIVVAYPDTHPQLYMNLIGTALSDSQITDFMVTAFSADELSAWAILDTHVYYAWNAGLSGCTLMNEDCAWMCSVDSDESGFAAVTEQIRAAAASSHSNFLSNTSIPLQGCSEFSLATYHDSENACRGFNMLEMMYAAQADGFEAQGILDRSLFWTWKMPYGGSHEAAWSVQSYFRKTNTMA
mmetsp:Transcript_15951/g.26731  ORF Transcript_15951/g.26731 Transcript_15951/m.26731 type:complete len:440 (-) Transcript_15951:290-1609(-)